MKVLNVLDSPKKVIYLSSVNPPPFVHRYISTKMESEEALFRTEHDSYAIRPGFIYDWELKKWSIALRYAIKGWNRLYPHLYSLVNIKFNKAKKWNNLTKFNKII